MKRGLANRPFFIKLLHWEYWSFSVVYFPIYIVWVGLCIRARSFFFFAASNPAIKNGGFLNESKKDIIPMIPADRYPKTLFFSLPADPCQVLQRLEAESIHIRRALQRTMTEMADLPLRDHVWPKFLRTNALRLLGLSA